MLLTIALSGMDSATETALRAAFAGANHQLGDRCALVPESESQLVIVDMDSMYGPMSWLRLHAAGKQVIGLTSAPRVQTHFRLGRPFDESALVTLLRDVAHSEGVQLTGAPPAPAFQAADNRPAPDTARDKPAEPVPAPAPPVPPAATRSVPDSAGTTPTPQPPQNGPLPGDTAPLSQPSANVAETPAAAPADLPTLPASASTADVEASVPRELPFGAWLAGKALRGRHRYRSATGPTLLIDFDAQQYHGPATLKPMAPYFDGQVERDAFEWLDDAQWNREATAAGAAQPLLRLRWLGALLEGDGSLAPGHDPDARYSLNKWPQTEREYPRHFRIATAMMKGPATLAEIIVASGLPADEVYRFVNASLATGYAEPVVEVTEEDSAPQKTGGFFSRLRRG